MTALNKQARHVQRYTNYGVDMMEWDYGTYVKYSDYLARLDELETAEKRIAELEARKFKVEMPESFYPDGDIDAPLVVDELEVIAAIVDAGGKPVAFCKRCDRETDLTHRPDGSHYCHAPAAGIGEEE
ncbi:MULTISPECIES: hypothetical protein [Citrobacter]|uniref:hypothetical protein n=1 Tax=Citrobacter TaxID=544 RepID=UPI001901C027|nr:MULTISPECIES: hypothetical protein [Citrobacter]MBJ8399454.1 hypothetical protein [Citrobacter youngae]MBJ9601682.1 hypothetical protein [Citrobacter sp. FDAARGOS_156]